MGNPTRYKKKSKNTLPEVIITQDEEYNRFLNTLPDNQRLTPNEEYDTYLYWKLHGKPKDFQEALNKEMYSWDPSDQSYHGNSIAWGDNGVGYFIKPKTHDTLKYELDWFNKNIVTEPGGHQRFETPEERAESDEFRRNYILTDDPTRPNFYIYKPRNRALGGHLFDDGGSEDDLTIPPLLLGQDSNTARADIKAMSPTEWQRPWLNNEQQWMVNPKYWGNTRTKGTQEDVTIVGYIDGKTAIARYPDGTYGPVGLPDDFTQGVLPELVVYGNSRPPVPEGYEEMMGVWVPEELSDDEKDQFLMDTGIPYRDISNYRAEQYLNQLKRLPASGAVKSVYPEFDVLTLGRGLVTNGMWDLLKEGTKTAYKEVVPEAIKPGGSFWTHPLTKGMAYGTLMSNGVDLATNLFTGYDSFGQGLLGTANYGLGLLNNNWGIPYNVWTETAADMFNPGWWMNPEQGIGALSRATQTIGKTGRRVYNAADQLYDRTSTYLQNRFPAIFDPYTSWDATLGYHGDNILSRVAGTYGRKWGITPSAHFPELHRRIGIGTPEGFRVKDDGKIVLSSGRTGDGHEGIVNTATSEPARSHQRHKTLSGVDDFIIDPRAVEGEEFLSIEPSDTFFKTDEFAVNPKYLTFVSGDTDLLNEARQLGMRTLSSPRLRSYNAQEKGLEEVEDLDGSIRSLADRAYDVFDTAAGIGEEIQRLTSMRGAPTLKDYAVAEEQTGLNSGVIPNTEWYRQNMRQILPKVNRVRGGSPVFNNVLYNPATPIESMYRKAVVSGKQEDWDAYYTALRRLPSARSQVEGLGMYNYQRPLKPVENTNEGAQFLSKQDTGASSAKIKDTGKTTTSEPYNFWNIVPKAGRVSPYGQLEWTNPSKRQGLDAQFRYARDFISHILIPRAKELGIWNQEFVDKWNIMHPTATMRPMSDGTWGWFGKNGIALKDDEIPISTFLHELRHSFDANSSKVIQRNPVLRFLASDIGKLSGIHSKAVELTPSQEKVLKEAYLPKVPFKEKLKNIFSSTTDYTNIEEMITTNTEAQAALYNQYINEYGKRPELSTFYKWIDDMDEMELVRRINAMQENGYWSAYTYYNLDARLPKEATENYILKDDYKGVYADYVRDWGRRLKSALKIPGWLPILAGTGAAAALEAGSTNSDISTKALGGTLSGNSDSIVLADNNNYIQDFKGGQYGLPVVRYANGGHLFDDGNTVRTTPQNYTGYTVNPMYWGNMRTTEGQPIKNIIEYLDNNRARVQYEDGTTGIVEYPQNFVQGIAPEVTVYGRSALNDYNTANAIIDNAYDGMTYEEIAQAKERAKQTMDEYAQEHTNEGLALYKDQIQQQAVQRLIDEADRDPVRDLEWGLGDILSLGTLSAEKRAVDEFNKGNYWDAAKYAAMPLMFGRGLPGSASRFLIGGANLAEDVPTAYQDWYQRNYGDLAGRLPGIGLNALLFGHGAYGIADDVLNTAAQLGNADAKAIQFARALNKDIGNTTLQTNPRSISTEFTIDPVSNNLDAEYTLYDAFGDKMGKGWMAGVDDGTRYVNGIKSTNIGRGVTEDIYNTAVTDTSNGLRSGVTTMYSPQKTLAVTRGKMGYVHEGFNEEGQPVTRITSPSQKPLPQRVDGSHYQEVAPKTIIRFNEVTGDLEEVPIKQEEEYVPTSWRFYERGPARISEAERLGIPKGERGMLTDNERQALEDLSQYRNSGQYRQRFKVDNQENPYWGGANSEGVNFVKFAIDQNFPFKYDNFRVNYSTDTGQGVLSYNPNRNMASYSSDMFTAPSGFKWAPGEANMFIDGDNASKIILTAPKTDAQGLFFDGKPVSEIVPEEELSSTIDKSIMKDFWTKVRQIQRPGTYLSGDNGRVPKGSDLIQAFKKKQLHKVDFKERPLKEQFVTRDGVSPDAFSSIVRQGLRDGSLRWGEGFAKWNNSAVYNKQMYEAWQQYMKNQITAQEYESIYNNWMESLGANKPLQWLKIGNKEYPIHPHPYIYQKDLGGHLNTVKV